MINLPVDSIKATIGDVFASLGQNIVVRTVISEGTFDPITGGYSNRIVRDRIMRGVDVGNEQRWLNGLLVASEGYVIYLFDDSLGPVSQNAVVVMGDEEIGIQNVEEYKIIGTRLAYRLTLAG